MPFQPYNPGDSLEVGPVFTGILGAYQRAQAADDDRNRQMAQTLMQQRQQGEAERAARINEHRVQIEDARLARQERIDKANALPKILDLARGGHPYFARKYAEAYGENVDVTPVYAPEQATAGPPQQPQSAPQGGSPVPDGVEFAQPPQGPPPGPPMGMPGMGPMDGGPMAPNMRQPPPLPTQEPAPPPVSENAAMARKLLGHRLSLGGQTLYDPVEDAQLQQQKRAETAALSSRMFPGDPEAAQMFEGAIMANIPADKALADAAAFAKERRVQGAKNEHDKAYELTAPQKYRIGMKPTGEPAGGAGSIDLRTVLNPDGTIRGNAPGSAKVSPEGIKAREMYAQIQPIKAKLADIRQKVIDSDWKDEWGGKLTARQQQLAGDIDVLMAPTTQFLGSGTPQAGEAKSRTESFSISPLRDKQTALANIDSFERFIDDTYAGKVRSLVPDDNARMARTVKSGGKKAESPGPAAKTTSPADQAAIDWANANPGDPRSKQILQLHGM